MKKQADISKADFEALAEQVRFRINSVLVESRLTENSVAAGDSATQSRLNSQLSHGKKITLDTVLRILNACPDISADWLLRGTGEKYSALSASPDEPEPHILSESFVKGLLEEKDKQIDAILKLLAK